MTVIEHSGPTCNRCGVTYVPEGEGQTCGEPYCNGRVTWEATADRLASQLRAAVEALHRYGTHLPNCALLVEDEDDASVECDCGFAVTLRAVGGQ